MPGPKHSLPARLPAFLIGVLAGGVSIAAFLLHRFPGRQVIEVESPSVSASHAQAPLPLADRDVDKRVEKLLAAMSLKQKIGQLSQYSYGVISGPGTGRENIDAMILQGEAGSIFNMVGANLTNRYQKLAVERSALHIPLLFGFDVIHGERTIFPVPLALASSFDPPLIEQVSRVAGREATEDGIRWVFSPMVDIARDARWGRITEGAGEDTYLGSALARAYVRGYQGDKLSDPDSVAACVKHFAGYGAPNAGREYNTVDMSELTLRQVYLPPYKAAVDAGAATVMSALNPLNGIPSTANPFLLTKILRQEWGFGGFVVCDYDGVSELINHGIAETESIASLKAISSGVDMDMESDLYRTSLGGLVRDGALPEATLDEAVRRVLRVKFALGLFDHPYAKVGKPYVATPEKRALARKAAEEAIVLLKNGNAFPYAPAILPLGKKTPSIALIGPLADSQVDMLGSWPAAGDADDAVTLRTALQARCDAAKGKLFYAKGTDILTDSEAGFDEAVAAARQAAVVVLALGESGSQMTGESSSVTRLDLPGNQEKLLETIARLDKPTVLVLFDGRPLAIKWAAAHVPAIVEAWYPGIEAGPAVADILFGDANPSGKLPVTFPRAVGQEPLFYNQLPTGRPAGDVDLSHPPTSPADKYFSRYIDETNAPLFPFGYGLSYTEFAYSNVAPSQAQISARTLSQPDKTGLGTLTGPSNKIRVSAEVRNTGVVPGVEVVQLYVRNLGGSVEEPVRELKGFQRVELKPGETKRIEFSLGFDELAHYDWDLQQVVEPSTYQVWIGGNSEAEQRTQFEVTP